MHQDKILPLLVALSLAFPMGVEAQHCHDMKDSAETTEVSAEAATEPDELEIPNANLLDQEGREVNFRDLVTGNVVAINFVFTTCTTVCPPMGANFGKLQQLLGDRAGRDVHLISVSIDPAVDTPHRLRAWSQKFGAGPGWTLVTGSKPTVDQLLKDLGVFIAEKQYHAPITLLGNEGAGTWQRTNGLTPAPELLRQLEDLTALDGALDSTNRETSQEEVAP